MDREERHKLAFEKNYLPSFTEYLSVEKLSKKIPSYQYLVEELHKLEITTTESKFKHVMGKKILLESKNCKQLCRDGIPIKYMREVLLKMYSVSFSSESYENKRKEVLKGRSFSEIFSLEEEDSNHLLVPTFGIPKKIFKEKILKTNNYLNEKGISALKEVLWLLNGVIPKIEYCPAIVGISSLLLLFLSKEETYEFVRNLIETDLDPGELGNIRWHFRYNLTDNLKLYLSIVNSIMDISKEKVIEQFNLIESYGLSKIRLIQEMCDNFFIDFLNFIGIIKFLPFFLYEGVKGCFRFCYALIDLCPFKMILEEEEIKSDENKLVTLADQVSVKFQKIKKPPEEVLSNYKEITNKMESWYYFIDTASEWGLTHRNNGFPTIKIPRELKEKMDEYLNSEKEEFNFNFFYIPVFSPKSKILKHELIPKLWEKMPFDVKFFDGVLLFDKASNPDGNLGSIYKITEKLNDEAMVMFLVETSNDEVFGGIMKQNIKLYDEIKFLIPSSAYLFSVEPNINVYIPKDKVHSEIACFEPGALRFGNGNDGCAISIERDLKNGWNEKDSVFGNNIKLVADYDTNGGEFEIKSFEVFIMQ